MAVAPVEALGEPAAARFSEKGKSVSGLIEQIVQWAEAFIAALGYPGIAVVMFLETVFPPIPSEVVMPFAGFTAARGDFNLIGVIIAGTIGAVAGATLLYGVGAWVEDHIILGIVRRYGKWLTVSEQDLARSLALFNRYGAAAVFVGRLMPAIRSLISLPAGMSKMHLGRFFAFTAFGSLMWNSLLAGAGFLLGENWGQVESWLAGVEQVLYVVFAVIGVGLVIWYVRRLMAQYRA